MNSTLLQIAGYSIGGIGALIFVLIGFAIYMIPTIVARGKRSFLSIAALNLLLGWTLLGWVGALVWALYKEKD